MRRHPATVQLVKDGFEQGKVVAAICHAGWMLTSAEVVVDGTLITSRKPDDLPAFCREIIEALA
jgi:protease I